MCWWEQSWLFIGREPWESFWFRVIGWIIGNAALSLAPTTCVELAKLYLSFSISRLSRQSSEYEWHQSIYSSLHHFLTNAWTITHFSSASADFTSLRTLICMFNVCEGGHQQLLFLYLNHWILERTIDCFYFTVFTCIIFYGLGSFNILPHGGLSIVFSY